MTDAPLPRLHHIALTVTELDTSIDWYQKVFSLALKAEVPHPGGTGKILRNDAGTFGFVLHRHDTNNGEKFNETRAGLDHVGLAVSTRADLEAWQWHLEEHGVLRAETADRPCTQSPIADQSYGSVLVFRDPDNIQLELFSPAAQPVQPNS